MKTLFKLFCFAMMLSVVFMPQIIRAEEPPMDIVVVEEIDSGNRSSASCQQIQLAAAIGIGGNSAATSVIAKALSSDKFLPSIGCPISRIGSQAIVKKSGVVKADTGMQYGYNVSQKQVNAIAPNTTCSGSIGYGYYQWRLGPNSTNYISSRQKSC